jgi:catalase
MRSLRLATLAAGAVCAFALVAPSGAQAQDDKPIAVKLVDQFNTLFGQHPGFRANHAKGLVAEGEFTPAKTAASLSSAEHLQKKPTPATIRFSDSSGIPDIADNKPAATTRGIAIKFHLADGSETDLIGITLKGFPAGTGEDFLAFLKAVGASGPDAPKPTPLQTFLADHPNTAKIVGAPVLTPVSWGTAQYNGINAFKFTNAKGDVKYGRYRIVPVAGTAYVKPDVVAKLPPNALGDNLKAELAKHPVKFKILVQLAKDGDNLTDATEVWADTNPTVELGILTIKNIVPDSLAAEKPLLFLPTNLTPGIEASDDPLIQLRAEAYAESFGRRSQ